MNNLKKSLQRQGIKFRHFTMGGEWAIPLPKKTKNNLFWFFFDGLFASASDNIIVTYLVLYLLALGATQTQIGIMSSLSSFISALVLIPGALLVERIGKRKGITMVFGGGIGRLVILIASMLPFIYGGQVLVWSVIGLSVSRDAAGNFSFPAWMDIAGSIVPMKGRGRFFGSRNFIMAIAGISAILLVGALINRVGQPGGYQVALCLAAFLGLLSLISFKQIDDPNRAGIKKEEILEGNVHSHPLNLSIKNVIMQPVFFSFALISALWNLSVNIASPFFSVYMVENLHLTAGLVGLVTVSSTTASMFIQRKSGEISDRWGPRRIQMICMLLIPLITFFWSFAENLWQAIVINIFSGLLWGTFGLVSFNFLLTLLPETQRARFSAIFQIFTLIALALGAAIGSLVVGNLGIRATFLISSAARFLAALLFLRFAVIHKNLDKKMIYKKK